MGNIFARRPGKDNSLSPVMTGSHIDSQPTGGKFDGIYGVMAGLEVVRTLNDFNYETTRPVEVVVWTNEEGSRFAPAMVASGVFAGVFPLEYGLSRADLDGKTMGEELKRIGYDGDRSRSAAARWSPSSRPISSRARSWKPRRRPSAWSRARRASAGTRSPWWGRRPMPARRR